MFIWINWKALLKIIPVALSKTYLFIVFFTKAVTIFFFFHFLATESWIYN